MDLSIIIVSWNVADLLIQCLQSIQESLKQSAGWPQTEIIVVDSASDDDTVARVQRDFPQVILLPQTENIGFSRGNNIGLEHATGRYIFLLNPDTVVLGDALSQMVRYLEAHPQVGILGPHTLNSDGSTQSTRRRFPTKWVAFFESTWLQSLAPKSLLDQFYVHDQPDDGVYEVDWVQGSALMAQRAVYQSIGGLDPFYIMYSEELDWCKRAKDNGWQVVYFGKAQIIHHGGKSSEQVPSFKHVAFQKSKIRYYAKHHSSLFAFILRLFLLGSYGWQLLVEAFKALLGHKRALRRERIKTYWHVLRSGLR